MLKPRGLDRWIGRILVKYGRCTYCAPRSFHTQPIVCWGVVVIMVYDIFISIILGVSPYTSPMNNEMRIYFCISICEMNPTKPSSPPLASLGNRQQLESPEQFQSSAVCAFIIERHTRFKAKKDPAVGGLVGWGSCTISSLQLLRYVVALSFGDKRRATNFFLHDPIIVQMQL